MTANPQRRRYQFSLRTLFAGLTTLAILLGLYVPLVGPAERQKAAVRRLESLGGHVVRDTPPRRKDERPEFWGKRLLREMLPVDYFDNVIRVDLKQTQATDADVQDLYLFPKLEYADLRGTRVTKEEFARLKKRILVWDE